MNTINHKISFGSTIHISRIAYAREVVNKLGLPSVDAPWTIADAKYLKAGFSEDASHCTMGVIKNEFGDGFMFHLRPGASKLNAIFENLQKAKNNLKYANNLTGFLLGGTSGYKYSKEQYQTLQSMFKELNIKYSALLGQNDINSKFNILPYCNLYFNGTQDKYVVCPVANRFNSITFSKMREIYELFDTVIIRKGDEVKLG